MNILFVAALSMFLLLAALGAVLYVLDAVARELADAVKGESE